MNKPWYIQTVEYIQYYEEMNYQEKTWKKIKCILLSEGRPSEKTTYCIIPTIGHSAKGETMGKVNISGFPGVGGGVDMSRQSTEDLRSVKIHHMTP